MLKKYIENLKIYNNLLKKDYENNKNFVKKAFPQIIEKSCSEINADELIYKQIIEKKIKKDPSWCNNPNLTEAQIACFYESYINSKNDLCIYSNRLKKDYYFLKETIDISIKKANDLYKE